jgi:hypothetical protein
VAVPVVVAAVRHGELVAFGDFEGCGLMQGLMSGRPLTCLARPPKQTLPNSHQPRAPITIIGTPWLASSASKKLRICR